MSKSPAEKIMHATSFMIGEVHALFMFCQAVAMMQTDRAALLVEIEKIEQLGLGNIEWQPIPDAVLDGFRFGMDGLRKATKDGQAIPRRDGGDY